MTLLMLFVVRPEVMVGAGGADWELALDRLEFELKLERLEPLELEGCGIPPTATLTGRVRPATRENTEAASPVGL
jgi:hypothetical protein